MQQKPKDGCACEVDFFCIVDSTYQEYMHEVVFPTMADYKYIDAIYPSAVYSVFVAFVCIAVIPPHNCIGVRASIP
jgi:hypothetical protein